MDEHYYETVRNVWKTRVDALYNGLNAIEGVTHNRPKGAFYTMVELPVKSSEDFAKYSDRFPSRWKKPRCGTRWWILHGP